MLGEKQNKNICYSYGSLQQKKNNQQNYFPSFIIFFNFFFYIHKYGQMYVDVYLKQNKTNQPLLWYLKGK